MDEFFVSDQAFLRSLHGREYGWNMASFPGALKAAMRLGYACLGGQFQFRTDDGICEMYWLAADSADRLSEELWSDYVRRSCGEVSQHYQRLVAATDFRKMAFEWPTVSSLLAPDVDPTNFVVFVAYFVTEIELKSLSTKTS